MSFQTLPRSRGSSPAAKRIEAAAEAYQRAHPPRETAAPPATPAAPVLRSRAEMPVAETSGLRRIEVGKLATGVVAATEFGPAPVLQWVEIAALRIQPRYQREIFKRGVKNVRAIAAVFDWRKFGTVIVAPIGAGLYAIVDGQHRTTAAAICGIRSVPCQVIIADEAEQAEAFAAINGNVTKLTPMQIHAAKVTAADPATLALTRVCEFAGVTICRYPVPARDMKPGMTLAVAALAKCLAQFGAETLSAALRCITRTRNGNIGMVRSPIVTALCRVLAGQAALVADAEALLRRAEKIDFPTLFGDAAVEAKRARRSIASLLEETFRTYFEGRPA